MPLRSVHYHKTGAECESCSAGLTDRWDDQPASHDEPAATVALHPSAMVWAHPSAVIPAALRAELAAHSRARVFALLAEYDQRKLNGESRRNELFYVEMCAVMMEAVRGYQEDCEAADGD